MEIIGRPNPFDPNQSYSPTGSVLVDVYPKEPGQVGFVYDGQERPYPIQALGDSSRVIVSPGEGE